MRSASVESHMVSGFLKMLDPHACHVISKLNSSMSRIQPAKSLRWMDMSMPSSRSAALKSDRNLSSLAARERKVKRNGRPSFSSLPVFGFFRNPASVRSFFAPSMSYIISGFLHGADVS